jgi:hypothetical protein
VGVALRAFVPLLLTLLSLLFGPRLRESGRAVSNAGKRAQKAIRRARQASTRSHRVARTRRRRGKTPSKKHRVDERGKPRVRLEDQSDEDHVDEDMDEDVISETGSRRRHRR